ncbi:MAG: hypothetical protein ACRC7N_00940 [Clostridium sp.]
MDNLDRLKREIYHHIDIVKQKEYKGEIMNSIYVKGYVEGLQDVLKVIQEINDKPMLINKDILREDLDE